MEQPCFKCGQVVEEGRVFCPHCMAPQIRVVVAESIPATTTFGEPSAITHPEVVLPATETVPVLALSMRWSHAIKPCALAAIVASVLMLLGLNLLVAMFSVGFLAVVFYRHGQPALELKAWAGLDSALSAASSGSPPHASSKPSSFSCCTGAARYIKASWMPSLRRRRVPVILRSSPSSRASRLRKAWNS